MNASGPYRLEVSGESRRELQRLPPKIAAAVVEFFTEPLLDNPSRLSKPLSRELSNHRIAHRGEYRVLIRVDDLSGTVLVVRIDHRAHAYRPR